MQIDNLSWFPGHMTKTKRMISAEIKNMDAVCEIVDARIPMSSRNPDVDELTAGKPRLIVLNRADQADPAEWNPAQLATRLDALSEQMERKNHEPISRP